jgi:hypothetical protein
MRPWIVCATMSSIEEKLAILHFFLTEKIAESVILTLLVEFGVF